MANNPHNKPAKPAELQLLNYLKTRMHLPTNSISTLRKGFKGEQSFYHLLETNRSNNYIVLYDLLLESNQTQFQIDCLIIYQQQVYMIEIKNYEGDFYISDDKWYAVPSKKEIRNPLLQLKRSEFLLHHLLHQLGYNFPVKPYIVFINPLFTLYQAPFNQSIIFPGQLTRFIKELNAIPTALAKNQAKLAQQLTNRHLKKSIYSKLPEYTYNELKKGITCCSCGDFMSTFNRAQLLCKYCGKKENIDSAVMRSVEEFKFLFPDKKITTSIIRDWCKIINSKKTIRRILMKHMTLVGLKRGSHYISN